MEFFLLDCKVNLYGCITDTLIIFFIVTLKTVILYECYLVIWGIVMSDSLNNITQLEHDRPSIENGLLNLEFSILSAMSCGFFSI